MAEKKAFPILETDFYNCVDEGMDLRDYFAAKATHAHVNNEFLLQRLLSDKFGTSKKKIDAQKIEDLIAEVSYSLADSMIEHRNKTRT